MTFRGGPRSRSGLPRANHASRSLGSVREIRGGRARRERSLRRGVGHAAGVLVRRASARSSITASDLLFSCRSAVSYRHARASHPGRCRSRNWCDASVNDQGAGGEDGAPPGRSLSARTVQGRHHRPEMWPDGRNLHFQSLDGFRAERNGDWPPGPAAPGARSVSRKPGSTGPP